MGIFNEQTFDHPFAKGIQGAPGVGFSLTADGNYDINKKRLTNVGAPSNNTDAATKKYVDDNSSGSQTTTRLTVDSNIDMKDRYRILNLITPQDSKDPATKYYVDNTFLDRDGSYPMKGNLNMDNKQILNLPAPMGPKQPTPLGFTDMKYLHVAGTNKMTNNLNMDNKKIINLRPPTDSTDGATKKYVDDSIPDTSSFIKKDGSVAMTSNLNLGNKKIVGLATPVSNTDAATKKYVDDNTGAPDLSDYLEKDGTVTMTGNLNLGNNKINLGVPTQDNEAVNKGYVDNLVHHTAVQPSHYKDEFSYLMTSGSQWTDEIDGGVSFVINKIGDLSPSKGNFHDYNHKFFIHILVDILRGGYNISTYPRLFSGVYIIAYGIVGTFSNIDPDKVYDYHTAFDIKPTEVVYNVDINANQKEIKNIKLDRQNDNSAATVALVKELAPHTKNALYRLYFSDFYDFADADTYGINIGSFGVIINSLKPNITLPHNKDLSEISEKGLHIN
ncbi:unnamed protein product, partial [Porites evermanni]